MSSSWINKYGPKKIGDIVCNKSASQSIQTWLKNWDTTRAKVLNYQRDKLKPKDDKTKTKIPQSPFLGTTEQLRQYIDAILLNTPPPVPIDEAYDVMKLAREIGDCLNKKRCKKC